ncbi:MAG TPA: SMC-Scp complex subunit ScpB [Candidatus Onthousia faecipullorum]|uniref:Segregation and condensation protein B n=1 Tax=Candidatus Onthousia faecipullorum TaxID=2840887 RepID=A0A9D1G9J7_9FIRM|nr:SMC-Scp complex subunit ScpB [Candidatus Onthousia faecipullorum]
MNLKAVIEGLLFVVGDDGLGLEEISKILEISKDETKELIKELQNDYQSDSRGIRIDFLGDKLKLTTKKEHNMYYQKLLTTEDNNNLSQAALETLAIIAYNQPITRVKVDELRGISNTHIIRKLVAKGLIKESGRSNMPGRPILYETTSEFLDYFGLSSIDNLPDMRDFLEEEEKDTEDEVDLYQSKYKEEN